ncbi:hypothetical protein HOU41_gp005 [Proteus phage Stubb]|uniref:Uncharacterized protein n=1 Tax=Proteus phage Stubb TaxID=2315597 RepID=A0A3B8E4R4_9CAUD|nr:hypothetical protein HOU41_gp005 [Proteus phage Stubb]AYJ73145.1 hypothetical protein CPT_Stubb_005 [Proteus phage Stubb]
MSLKLDLIDVIDSNDAIKHLYPTATRKEILDIDYANTHAETLSLAFAFFIENGQDAQTGLECTRSDILDHYKANYLLLDDYQVNRALAVLAGITKVCDITTNIK